ncbi:hypothetical protein PR003_g29089 [Phytophthora rubi]|uniref:Uncharacterized protein n=1 Tax=Phytophthora rubi TaxID=129364 RepID=A0A6A4BTM5_9STRA|nr:hypothetical protein PR003_g29089 [Phytophthora rubi]
MLLSLCLPPQCPPCCARCAGRRHACHAALAAPATATLAVPLWPGSPECCPTVARAAAMLTISPCCCRCAFRRNARRAALAMPAAAMLVVLLSLSPLPRHYRYARRAAVAGLTGMLPDGRPCRRHAHHLAMLLSLCLPLQCPLLSLCLPPQCPPCYSRCPRYRYARRAAVTALIGMLPDVRIRRRRHARCSSVVYAATMLAAAMPAVQQSLLPVPLCLPPSFLVSFDASLIWSSSASRCQC